MKNKINIKVFRETSSAVTDSRSYFTNLKLTNMNLLFIKCFCIVFVLLCTSACYASVYTDTITQIKNMYSKSSMHTHKEFLDLEIVNDDSKLKEFLEEISENKDGALLKVKGYYHPIGFIKLVLYKGEKGEQLRIHFWGKGGNKAINQNFYNGWEPIHNHRWNFSSKVIKGGLIMKEYVDFDNIKRFNSIENARKKLAKLNETFKMYDVSVVPTNGKNYKVIKTGKFALIGDCMNKYVSSNGSYWLSNTTPHQVKAEKDTSTLLLMDPPAKSFASEIFSNKKEAFEDNMNLQNLTHREIQVYIKEFLQDLKESVI